MRRLFIVDYRMREESKAILATYGDVVLFHHPRVKGSLSGHPDISIFTNRKALILASDAPAEIVDALNKYQIHYITGEESSGPEHPATATYNACGSAELLIHNLKFTSQTILDLYPAKEIINVNQGYSRCSTLLLDAQHLLTSDAGIAKRCKEAGKEVLFVDSKEIILPGLEYGLLGGCFGLFGETAFLNGALKYMQQGAEIKAFISSCGYTLVELVDAVPVDVGGIFVL